ncbi:hypothetical protein HBZC1_00610 [Helicobacter bizzozeronii CIII-1]|uniref:Uncharacterized protein n=1 Tax=Helicobacter bizzozeronii (strain CIII-1) TaxID=1002804 RepID=F8KQP3_HELBC|nr:hypothetical protein [Helicobacter bizzozeronii]CCB79047.1 hypothetical protein HBZC1_00610 [Helicobacter bizzozeronii CIII-1]
MIEIGTTSTQKPQQSIDFEIGRAFRRPLSEYAGDYGRGLATFAISGVKAPSTAQALAPKPFNSAIGQFGNPTTYASALNGAQQGFNSLSMFANATSPAQQSTQNVIFGSKGMMKMGLALEGINTLSNLFSLGANIWSTSEQIKMAKKQHDLARQQFDTENARYEAREKERISNNEQISKSAALFEASPMSRE